MSVSTRYQNGFTLIELIIVIVVLGVLSIVALPRFIDLSSDAKIASLEELAKQAKSTTQMVQYKAIIQGLQTTSSNPGNGQSEFIVNFSFGSVEVDFRSLCPESQGELGNRLDFLDFMSTSFNDQITTRVDNQYTLFGYDVPTSGTPTNQGCYIIYDSFAEPQCTIEVVTADC
ncbi:type II secretion system protein [Glaciecola petra]|uniref:Type II secretion system protein n=1 Tax=Glaciecola petra TaxID=3075602 RepID=A0ABU2ZR85_9ALTE|nr:type II secretion system protein [Aestuariibacter sp. P117]MDT0594920.1 type II secretion system protein [Aestuariibacter sp. P117]